MSPQIQPVTGTSALVRDTQSQHGFVSLVPATSRPVWFDFENTPHVLFLEPLIRRLRDAGVDVRLTARPHAQTVELAALRGLEACPIGSGNRRGWKDKVVGVLQRAAQLVRWLISMDRPALLVSCSRSASIAARCLGVEAVGMLDYEHAELGVLRATCRVIWLPDLLRNVQLPWRINRIARFYEGLKENLYLDDWRFDRGEERARLGARPRDFLVVARPPATTAHYVGGKSWELWRAAVLGLAVRPNVRVMLVARDAYQRTLVARLADASDRIEVARCTLDGPNAVDAADLVVGGGGTMNREAAVLGVPVWSVFTGPAPHIDECLAAEGRLRWVRTDESLRAALRDRLPERCERRGPYVGGLQALFADIATRLAEQPKGGMT